VISGTVEVDDVSEGQARSVGGDFVSEFWMGEPSASMRIDTEGENWSVKKRRWFGATRSWTYEYTSAQRVTWRYW
jgi:hypothetical protein